MFTLILFFFHPPRWQDVQNFSVDLETCNNDWRDDPLDGPNDKCEEIWENLWDNDESASEFVKKYSRSVGTISLRNDLELIEGASGTIIGKLDNGNYIFIGNAHGLSFNDDLVVILHYQKIGSTNNLPEPLEFQIVDLLEDSEEGYDPMLDDPIYDYKIWEVDPCIDGGCYDLLVAVPRIVDLVPSETFVMLFHHPKNLGDDYDDEIFDDYTTLPKKVDYGLFHNRFTYEYYDSNPDDWEFETEYYYDAYSYEFFDTEAGSSGAGYFTKICNKGYYIGIHTGGCEDICQGNYTRGVSAHGLYDVSPIFKELVDNANRDPDGDGVGWENDNCPCVANRAPQRDCNNNGIGDACDPDPCLEFFPPYGIISSGHVVNDLEYIEYRAAGGTGEHKAELRFCECYDNNDDPYVMPECSISTTGCFQWKVAIYKNTVFYSNGYNSLGEDKQSDQIVKVDLEKKIQKIIWSREWPEGVSSYPTPFNPDVYNDNLVYLDACEFEPNKGTLCHFKSPWTGDENQSVLLENDNAYFLSMWGNKLVAADSQKNPDILATPTDISIYDFEIKNWSYVIEHEKFQSSPRIHENKVVWMDWRYSEGKPYEGAEGWTNIAIFAKDIETNEEWEIADGSALAIFPDIFGDIVTWLDFRHCPESQRQNVTALHCAEVYGYNLITKNYLRITNWPTMSKEFTRIWGNRIFFCGTDSGQSNYYALDVPEELKTP